MKAALGIAAAALALLSCSREEAPVVAAADQPSSAMLKLDSTERPDNRLSLLNGATVVDRSGELSLESSAMHAIDSDVGTSWTSPPFDLAQWTTIELAAPTKITEVGAQIAALADQSRAAKTISIESSLDGATYSPLATINLPASTDLSEKVSAEARFIKVSTVANQGGAAIIDVPELQLLGEQSPATRTAPVTGTWVFNHTRARLFENGVRVAGVVDMEPPMVIEGRNAGSYVKFAWSRGPQWGTGILTPNFAGDRINALWWFEGNIQVVFFGGPFFGRKTDAQAFRVGATEVLDTHMRQNGAYPLFGIFFDDSDNLDAERSNGDIELLRAILSGYKNRRFRLIDHQLLRRTSPQNLASSRKRNEALKRELLKRQTDLSNVEFVAAGDGGINTPITSLMQRTMFSYVELRVEP